MSDTFKAQYENVPEPTTVYEEFVTALPIFESLQLPATYDKTNICKEFWAFLRLLECRRLIEFFQAENSNAVVVCVAERFTALHHQFLLASKANERIPNPHFNPRRFTVGESY